MIKEKRFTSCPTQATGDGKRPKNPDVPRPGYDPKSLQTPLPQKK